MKLTFFKTRSWTDKLLILFFALWVTLLNWIYLNRNLLPPHWDMGRHLWTSLLYFYNFHWSLGGLSSFYSQYHYYPPLTYFMTIPWYALFGTALKVAVLSNIQWMLVLALSLYGIGRQLWSRQVGLVSAVAVLTVPLIAGHLREYQVDVPTTALVTLAFYLLLKTEYFRSPIYGLLFGLTLGLAFMTKWTAPAFLLLPLCAYAGMAIYYSVKEKKLDRIANLVSAGLVVVAVASIWYYDNRGVLRNDFTNNAVNAGQSEGDPQTFGPSLLWLLNRLFDIQLLTPLALLALTGLVLSFKKNNFTRNWPILLALIGTIIIFAKLGNKDVRYVIPYLPLWILLAVYWIFELKGKARRVWFGILAAVILLNLVTIQASWPKLPHDIKLKIRQTDFVFWSNNGYTSHYPEAENWPVVEILQNPILAQVVCPPGIQPKLSIVGDNILKFNDWAFWYENLRLKNNLEIASDQRAWNNEFMLIYGSSDMVAQKQATLGNQFAGNGLLLIKTYPLPDDTIANLYRVDRSRIVERLLCQFKP